jgi:hypothetical protein
MIDSESPSQLRPLESFKRSRFGLLAITSFIIQYFDLQVSGEVSPPLVQLEHSGQAMPRCKLPQARFWTVSDC